MLDMGRGKLPNAAQAITSAMTGSGNRWMEIRMLLSAWEWSQLTFPWWLVQFKSVLFHSLPDRTTGPGCRRNLDVVCLHQRTKTGSGERKTIDLRDHYFIVLHIIMCMCFSFQKSLIVSAFFFCVTSKKCVGGSGDGEIQMGLKRMVGGKKAW